MTLKQRLKAKNTKLGTILKTWVTYTLLIISGLGACLDYLSMLPADWSIPDWLKLVVILSGIITRIAGQLTVHPDDVAKLKDQ